MIYVKIAIMKKIIIIIISLALTACGFHLRSQNQLPEKLHVIYLASSNPYGPFESTFSQTLRSAGVTVVDAADKAPISLNIINANGMAEFATNPPKTKPTAAAKINLIVPAIDDAKPV